MGRFKLTELRRIYKPNLKVVDKLLLAEYYSDDKNLVDLLRLCVINPVKYHIVGSFKDKELLGVAILIMNKSSMIIWMFSTENFFEWFSDDFLSQLDKYAVENGCTRIKLFGRLGWLRKPPKGFKPKRVQLERKL